MDVVRLSAGYLADHGSESPRLDAELLVAHTLHLRRIDLYLQFDRPLDEAPLGAVRELLRRRSRGEPVAYLVGEREFLSRSFEVNPAVLVPRPETETLVQVVRDRLRERGARAVADLGTGSGCIAVSLAAELPDATVFAVDTSPAALDVARRNAERHGVAERVELVQGWWAETLSQRVDAVVSNPPYLTSAEVAAAPVDVRDFEPHAALDGGEDGLDAYRGLLSTLPRITVPGALIALEVDPRRAATVSELVQAAFAGAAIEVVDDLGKTPRVVLATLQR
jgi:release factor glutamine methyltransferase